MVSSFAGSSVSTLVRRSRASWLSYIWQRTTRPRFADIGGLKFTVDRRLSNKVAFGIYRQTHEAPERMIATMVVKPGDRVLEAGAGMGTVALTVARIVGAKNVTAYEPNELPFGLLVENAKLNGLPIEARRKALACKAGQVSFFTNQNMLASTTFQTNGGRHIKVEADDINAILAETRANVLILDVEGAETELIDHCQLEQVETLMIEADPYVTGHQANTKMIRRILESGLVLRTELAFDAVLTFSRTAPLARNRTPQ